MANTPREGGRELERRESRLPWRRGAPPIPSSPWVLARRMMEDMERFFDDSGFGRGLSQVVGPRELFGDVFSAAAWAPELDIFKRDDELVVRADLPGLQKKDLRLEVRENALVIEGERKKIEEEKKTDYFRSERIFGSFRRVIPLPEGVDQENIRAEMKNGVLEVCFKLTQEVDRGKKIEIAEEGEVPGQSGSVH